MRFVIIYKYNTHSWRVLWIDRCRRRKAARAQWGSLPTHRVCSDRDDDDGATVLLVSDFSTERSTASSRSFSVYYYLILYLPLKIFRAFPSRCSAVSPLCVLIVRWCRCHGRRCNVTVINSYSYSIIHKKLEKCSRRRFQRCEEARKPVGKLFPCRPQFVRRRHYTIFANTNYTEDKHTNSRYRLFHNMCTHITYSL